VRNRVYGICWRLKALLRFRSHLGCQVYSVTSVKTTMVSRSPSYSRATTRGTDRGVVETISITQASDYKDHIYSHRLEETTHGLSLTCGLRAAPSTGLSVTPSRYFPIQVCYKVYVYRFNYSPLSFMTDYDYFEHGRPSHDPPSFRQGDVSADGMQRSITRGSHNSHASASASTQSWINANQMNPPPPPVERSSSFGLTSFHGPRPLPEPQSVRRRPVRCPAPAVDEEEERDEEGMHIGPSSLGMQYGQLSTILARGEDDDLSPTPMGDSQDRSGRGGRSLIGGLMTGLRRLPTALRIGGGGKKSKKRIVRQGTFGTDGTSSPATGITTGNTLPRYLSNPSIRPSNPQFAHRLSIAVANGSLPPDVSPSAFQNRSGPPNPSKGRSFQPDPNPSPPTLLNHAFERHPEPTRPTLIRVTPPSASETITEEQLTNHNPYDEPPADHPQFENHAPSNPNTNDARATFMVYSSDDSHPTITHPAQPTHVPRVSYASQPTPRGSGQSRDEPPPVPAMAFALPPMSPPRGVSSVEAPKDLLSPQPTSRYTMTTMASHYDPSFASHLTPVERFFKGLYNLPWVARERVTIDYRPGDSNRAKIKVKGGVKRPMASWYRAVVSRSRRGSRDLDLLSNGTGSASASTSLGNSLTPLASPTSRRSERSSYNRYQSSPQNHRHRKRRRRATTSTDPPPQRSISPLVPGVYPYQYPPYPYTYPYGAYPPLSMPLPINHTAPQRAPRNRHRVPKYPHGYAPYQPMPPPQPQPPAPPMYFIAPSPPQNADGGQGMQMNGQQVMPQGPVQISPMIMQYVPGAFNQDFALASPPITPRRTAPQSS